MAIKHGLMAILVITDSVFKRLLIVDFIRFLTGSLAILFPVFSLIPVPTGRIENLGTRLVALIGYMIGDWLKTKLTFTANCRRT